jgi:hypothetical protein
MGICNNYYLLLLFIMEPTFNRSHGFTSTKIANNIGISRISVSNSAKMEEIPIAIKIHRAPLPIVEALYIYVTHTHAHTHTEIEEAVIVNVE